MVCDDETAEVELLCSMVRAFCEERDVDAEVRGISDYKRFLEDMAKVRADIVLLDICMGTHNGVEAARVLRRFNEECAVIFVTSSREYAVEAFEVSAAHYVVKPVTPQKLQEALGRYFVSGNGRAQDAFIPKKRRLRRNGDDAGAHFRAALGGTAFSFLLSGNYG